ncbi:hypothetical protein Zmor_018801 [Zophobas morio]|uniref:Uncharacterized protein n=1 Tax=Zophobas morio TaxID=2755281 RepID=A0AA38IEU6_9CUCU|nr:hypothetical protein Zmor_018801 [Zophobas morio]
MLLHPWNLLRPTTDPEMTGIQARLLSLRVIKQIRNSIGNNNIWISIDEMTARLGRYIVHLVIGKLSSEETRRQFLLALKQLDKSNSNTISRFINESLALLWPKGTEHKKVKWLVSDGASYMIKTGTNLKVSETIRLNYPDVNGIISNVKKIFLKAPIRVEWGTWIQAALFYAEHFDVLKQVVMSFEATDAQSIKKAQEFLNKANVKNELLYIKTHFKIIGDAIEQLETIGLKLNQGLHRVEIHNMFVYIIRTLFLWHLQTSFLSQAFTSISYITVDNEMYEKPHNESIILTPEPALAIIVKDKITKLFDGLFNLSYPLEYLKFINTSTVEIEPDFLNGQEVYSLSIQENNIKVLQTYTFRNLKLTLIDLSRNGIQIVENLAFANLSNLEKICLEGNKLTDLNSKAYENLPKFLDLILMENYITQLGPSSLGFVKTRDFMLFLSDNRIANIHEDAFRGSNATNVYFLLDNNLLRQISVNIFHNHSFLQVSLTGNKIHTLTGPYKRIILGIPIGKMIPRHGHNDPFEF